MDVYNVWMYVSTYILFVAIIMIIIVVVVFVYLIVNGLRFHTLTNIIVL